MYDNSKIGITFSAFDLLHAGHILMLEEASRNCDYLVACLQVDPSLERGEKNKPVQSLQERRIQLEAVKYVDRVIVYQHEKEIFEILHTVQPHVRFLGEEYIDRDFTGREFCIENDIAIYFNRRRHEYSSTDLRHRVYVAEENKR